MKLNSLRCTFLNFTSAPIGDGSNPNGIDGLGSDGDSVVEGMVDVSLTQSQASLGTGLVPSEHGSTSRMSASMFDPNMSQFYQSAKQVMAASMVPRATPNLFIGADPSIGVAVLRRTKHAGGPNGEELRASAP